jgi:phage shock protein PspC (stress-responsive transcriptional regulator)/predicted membrane protein
MMETNTTRESPSAADRPLRRSTSDKVVAGVASGIAARLDIPAWVVRVAFFVLTFGGGLGIALYIAGWVLIPAEGESEPLARHLFERVQGGSGWLGVVLVGVGVLIAASSVDFIRGDLAVAVFLGVIGVLLYRGEMGDRTRTEEVSQVSPTQPSAPTASVTEGDTDGPTEPPPPPAAERAPEPPKPARPPSILGRITVAAALIATGVMAMFDYAVSNFDPAPRHYIGLALGIVGVALIVGSVRGRARGLIFVGIVLVPWLILAPLAEFDLSGGIGQRRVDVSSVDQIEPSYDLAIGELIVDLRDVEFTGQTVELQTSVGIGSLRVLIPAGVGLELDAEVGVGEVQALGSVRSGIGRDLDMSREGVGTLVLDATTLVGEVRVIGAGDVNAGANTSVGEIDLVVTTPAQLEEEYQVRTGTIRLDLSNLVLRSPRRVSISNGIGRIEVIVPNRATTTINAHADLGQVVMFGSTQGGFNTDVVADATGQALLTLDIDIDSGEIVVEEG